MASSKNKQKVKRHKRNVKAKHRRERQKAAKLAAKVETKRGKRS